MVALSGDEKRIIELFEQLAPDRRARLILKLAGADPHGWERFQSEGEARLRQTARSRGKDWDAMTEDERQDFIEVFLDGNTP
jgi:hypothetical protein